MKRVAVFFALWATLFAGALGAQTWDTAPTNDTSTVDRVLFEASERAAEATDRKLAAREQQLFASTGAFHNGQRSGAFRSAATTAAQSWSNGVSTLFQGTNDIVSLGNVLATNSSNTEWTLSAWVYPTDLSDQRYIFAKAEPFADPAVFAWVLGVTSGGRMFGYWGSVAKTTESSDNGLTVNTWKHVAMTVRNISGTFTANLWINGTKVGSDVTSPGTATGTGIDTRFGAGVVADNPNTLYAYVGRIDEVTRWSVGMTQAQVAELSATSHPANPASHSQAASLTNYWRMGDGDTFPTIKDQVGVLDGTCTNMAGAATNFISAVP